MQKRANNFYMKNDRNNMNFKQNTEDNYYKDKYSQFNLTESKNINKDNINSPICDKKNFLVNTDLRFQNKKYVYESGEKSSNIAYFFKNSQSNNKIIPNKIINERNNTDMRYYTDYNTENDGLYDQEIQSKNYKKVIEQIYNNLYKYCLKFLLKDSSQFLKNLKEIASKNQQKKKTYKKKNIVNKNIYKLKKTPDKYNQNNNFEEKFTSPSNYYKIGKKEKNKFISQNASVNNSSSKNNVIYSNYYNLNIFENNTNNKYIYTNKKNQTKLLKDYNNYTLPEKNICINSSNDFHKSIGNRNNILYNYANRKKIIKTSIRKNPNINYTQPKNYQNINQEIKTNLKIDNKNSLEYIKNATKKKIIDKLENIKLLRQTNDNRIIDTKLYTKEELENKKSHFHSLMTKLKNISFYKHMEKYVLNLNNDNKKKFLENLKLKTKKQFLETKNKEQENINTENNINLNGQNEKEKENENNNINLNLENTPNKIDIDIDNKNDNLDEINNLKNIEINYESIDKKKKEENIDNNNQNLESKSFENLDNKTEEEKEENNINDENNLEMYSKESINNDDSNIINEDKNIEENNNEKNDNNININSQSKDENIEQVSSNEIEEDKLINNQFSNNQMINEKNEKEKIVTKIENEVKNEQREEEETIKGNDVNINIDEQSQINETQKNKSLQKIINSIILKENNNTLKKYLFKWSEKISDINLNEENELINKSEDDKEEIKSENEIENKNEKRNMINIKTLFLDEVDDEEKCVIMEEMVFRFRTLLMLSCFKNEEDLSD